MTVVYCDGCGDKANASIMTGPIRRVEFKRTSDIPSNELAADLCDACEIRIRRIMEGNDKPPRYVEKSA